MDPIEKKPLNHFLPGSSVLSFGTAGCNLACRFCQNWGISKSREIDRLSDAAMPEVIAAAAERLGCRSVAMTYNDPVIFLEYALDVADACRARGIKAVAGCSFPATMTPTPRSRRSARGSPSTSAPTCRCTSPHSTPTSRCATCHRPRLRR